MGDLKRMIKEMEDLKRNITLEKFQKSIEILQNGEYDPMNPIIEEINISCEEIFILREVLEEKGLIDGKNFLCVNEYGQYPDDDNNYSLSCKINDKLMCISVSDYSDQSFLEYNEEVEEFSDILKGKSEVVDFMENGINLDLSSLQNEQANNLDKSTNQLESQEDDLENMDLKQLERILQQEDAGNQVKKEYLRKQQLISQIKATQQEGYNLDKQIIDAKSQNRGE